MIWATKREVVAATVDVAPSCRDAEECHLALTKTYIPQLYENGIKKYQ
jgi:hypothetical protein